MRISRWAALAPLRRRDFRFLTGGQVASAVGDAFFAVALPWYVLATHGGPLLLAATLTAFGIPRTALLLVGGQASDRWRPWTVMMGADATRAVAVAVLAALALTGPASPAVLLPVAAVLGVGEGLFVPGSLAIVPTLLPEGELQAGNALSEGATQLAALVGPAIGGAVVAVTGAAPALAVEAVSFVVSAGTLAAIRAGRRAPVASSPAPALGSTAGSVPAGARSVTGRAESATGAAGSTTSPVPAGAGERPVSLRRLLSSERALQVVLLVVAAANLGSGGTSEVALPTLAHSVFRAGAGGYGALIAAVGGGALAGTLIAARTGSRRRPAVTASLAFLVEAACLAVVPYLGGALPAGVALAAFGVLNGFANVIAITAFQRWVPAHALGRTMGLLMLASFGMFPVSVAVAGVVVRGLGAAAWFPLAGAVLAAALGFGLSQPAWRRFGMEGVPAVAG